MSDMREDVARAVAEAIINVPGATYDALGEKGKAFYRAAGDAAIAVVLDDLIAEVLDPDGRFVGTLGFTNADDIADILRAKKAEVLGE